MSLCLVMLYCRVLSFVSKLTKLKDVFCLGTMKGRGHNQTQTKPKIVKALTCYIRPEAGPAPWGLFRGRVSPNHCLCPPQRELCLPRED